METKGRFRLTNQGSTFQQRIAAAIARENRCEPVWVACEPTAIDVIGLAADVKKAVLEYRAFAKQVGKEARTNWSSNPGAFEGLTVSKHWTAFWLGAAVLLEDWLRETSGVAQEETSQHYSRLQARAYRPIKVDGVAYEAGYEAAKKIHRHLLQAGGVTVPLAKALAR